MIRKVAEMCGPANLSASKSLAFLWPRMLSVNIRRESIVRGLCADYARIIFPSEQLSLLTIKPNRPVLIVPVDPCIKTL
jgi:hypothetical protein